jgi:NAD(P)-dependent dehydrogenase (short-subunit alcohol dehydrogenase family)
MGRTTALLFAREGEKVVVADVQDEAARGTVGAIKQDKGEAVFVHADVSKAKGVGDMIKTAVRNYGKLDVLFNNAGIEGAMANTADYAEDDFNRVISINLKGEWLGMKHGIPEMLKNGGGSIINMASVAGLVGFAGLSAYRASKGRGRAAHEDSRARVCETGDKSQRHRAGCDPHPDGWKAHQRATRNGKGGCCKGNQLEDWENQRSCLRSPLPGI